MLTKRSLLVPVLVLAAAVGIAAVQQVEPSSSSGISGTDAAISGTAQARDGDDLVVAGQRIRLYGIDAPELSQTCTGADGRTWPCGRQARDALARIVQGTRVTCHPQDRDRYGRVVARCATAQGMDINAEQVRQGWAVAFVRFSDRYLPQEHQARAARLGIWAGGFDRPESYRAGGGTSGGNRAAQAPAGCVYKGNINRNGERIYHAPGQRHYNATRIDPRRGERCFDSEDAAVRAGWRRSRI